MREAKLEGKREGQREGKEIGERIGLIHAYEQVLQLPETPDEQLLALPPEELSRLSQDLKQQALARR